jgi:hypothetical protein
MNSRLVVNGYELDLSDNIAVPLNLSITDVKEPEKRKRSFSKTLILEGTSNNMAFFLSAYSLDINIEESTNIQFTPNLRYDCEFFKNDLRVFKGKFKLNEVKVLNNNYSFDCNLISETVDIFAKLKDKKLNELDWSEYDHNLTRTNVIKSWNEGIKLNGVDNRNFGSDTRGYQPKSYGYIYPLVDYGYNMVGNSPLNFRINQLYPFIYVKEAVKKTLDFALEDTNIEVDYTTDFFTNTNMQKLIYGFGGGEQIKLNPDQIIAAKVELLNGTKAANTIYGAPSALKYPNGTPVYYTFSKTFNLLKSPINYTTINQDLNIVNLTDGGITFNVVGSYSISVSFDLTLSSSGSTYNTNYLTGTFYTNNIITSLDGTNISTNNFSQTVNTTASHSFNINSNIKTGQKLSFDFYLAQYVNKVDLTYSISNLQITVSANKDAVLTDNSPVSLSSSIPDIKCSEFFKGILNLFYAYMSEPIYNPVTNKSTIYIDSFINYYEAQENYDNWTDLIDESKDITIQSNSLIEGNIYQYTFSDEKDVLNAKYRELVGIGYGEKQLEIETWMNGVVKFELPFNTYIPYKIENSQLIYPIVKDQTTDSNNTTTSKPYKGKGMLTFYNGLRSGVVNIYNAEGSATGDWQIKYDFPMIHHLRFKDNYNFEPLFDLHFAPRNATFDGIKLVPDVNIFTKYHDKFVNEITSKNSKLVSLYLKLSYKDINELDFAKLKMIDGVLYRLNTIKDFDSDAYGTTEVELIKYLG